MANPSDTEPEAAVSVELVSFGLGNTARPGSWTPIRVRVVDRTSMPRELVVVVEMTDQDGDRPRYEVGVPAADERGREVWLPVWLPADFGPESVIELRVHLAVSTDIAARPVRPGALVQSSLVVPGQPGDGRSASTVLHPADGMIAVVGTRSAGLNQYATTTSGEPWSPLGHERTEIITGLTPADLPDHWSGYQAIDALVWVEGEPAELGLERPEAIESWVRRGGHLVVALPSVGQTWLSASTGNPLVRRGLLPDAQIVRLESGIDPADWRPLVADASSDRSDAGEGSSGRARRLPDMVVHELLIDPGIDPREASPILADAAGRVLVARRLAGLGMVTVIGLDVGSPELAAMGLPDAEVLWNRVLGRRGEFPLGDEARRIEAANTWTLTNRLPIWYDAEIAGLIAKTGRSATGLLLGFVVFGIYWVLAGPGGFALLRWRGLTRHAWMMFVATAAVFTALAWGGATLIRPSKAEARHLTVIDHVYLQPVQRTTTWLSLLTPSYGDATLRVGHAQTGNGQPPAGPDVDGTLIAPWADRRANRGIGGFPDLRPYAVDPRRGGTLTFPARATVKQFKAQWAGPPVDGWDMPRPLLVPGQTGEPRLWFDASGRLQGRLVHGLPGAIQDALVIVNRGQLPLGSTNQAQRWPRAVAYKLRSWDPGRELDLGSSLEQDESFMIYLDRLVPESVAPSFGPDGDRAGRPPIDAAQSLAALSLFHMLPGPRFRTVGELFPLARRWEMHGEGVSRWLTQPCVIVIGHVGLDEPVSSPTPMRVGAGAGGRVLATSGRTVVRWVYPLAPEPAGVEPGE